MTQFEIYLLAFILHGGIIQTSLVHGDTENMVIDVAGAKRCVKIINGMAVTR